MKPHTSYWSPPYRGTEIWRWMEASEGGSFSGVMRNCSSSSIAGLSCVSSPACASSESNWLMMSFFITLSFFFTLFYKSCASRDNMSKVTKNGLQIPFRRHTKTRPFQVGTVGLKSAETPFYRGISLKVGNGRKKIGNGLCIPCVFRFRLGQPKRVRLLEQMK